MEAQTQKKAKFYNPFSWKWNIAIEIAQEYAETFFVFLFFANGLATFLMLTDQVTLSESFRKAVGCVALAFSIGALVMFINLGVKHKLATKKKGRK